MSLIEGVSVKKVKSIDKSGDFYFDNLKDCVIELKKSKKSSSMKDKFTHQTLGIVVVKCIDSGGCTYNYKGSKVCELEFEAAPKEGQFELSKLLNKHGYDKAFKIKAEDFIEALKDSKQFKRYEAKIKQDPSNIQKVADEMFRSLKIVDKQHNITCNAVYVSDEV